MRMMQRSTAVSAAAVLLPAVALVGGGPIGPTGPDTFGHTGNDIAFNLRDIQATGTPIAFTDDDSEFVRY